jgi:adenylate cyclase class 2
MDGILKLMGYSEEVRVNKTRVKTNFKDYEICIDDVKDLGAFVEVEKIAEDGDGEKIQKELFEFLETLGVKKEDQVMHGYDTLLWHKYRAYKK